MCLHHNLKYFVSEKNQFTRELVVFARLQYLRSSCLFKLCNVVKAISELKSWRRTVFVSILEKVSETNHHKCYDWSGYSQKLAVHDFSAEKGELREINLLLWLLGSASVAL